MVSEILSLQIPSDRRQNSIPVENDRRSGVDRREIKREEPICIFKSIAPVRRLINAQDESKKGNGLSALGYSTLALAYLPEDLRDIRNAWFQLTDKNFKMPYDYKNYQHTFSFFRGGLFHKLLAPETTKCPKLAQKLISMDKTLFETNIGQKFLDLIKVDIDNSDNLGIIDTSIKNINHTPQTPIFVWAYKFKGIGKLKWLGEMTARAMARTTKLGLLALTLIEAPKVIKAMSQGETISEQTKNTAKQTVKSTVNIASTTAGIAYGGAIGAKYGKGWGSLVGMGVGAILGSKASNILGELTA